MDKRRRNNKKKPKPQQQVLIRDIVNLSPHPPQIQSYWPVENFTLRYTAAAATPAGGTNITSTNLLDAIAIATTAVAPYQLFSRVKLKSVEMWDNAPTGTNASVSCRFLETEGQEGDSDVVFSDIGIGMSNAHILAKPKKDALSARWHVNGAIALFNITCEAGCIIDVRLQYTPVIGPGGVGVACAVASVAAPVGMIFFRGLEGFAVAATNFICPLGTKQF